MKKLIKRIVKSRLVLVVAILVDFVLVPIIFLSTLWLRLVKFIGLKKLNFTRNILKMIGVNPVVNHYYEPYYYYDNISAERNLNLFSFNPDKAVELLKTFNFKNEISKFPIKGSDDGSYYFENGTFSYIDADLYYSIIRVFKPKSIIEIGSGYSTLIALDAIEKNQNKAIITCVEPFEMHWLENTSANILRQNVENINVDFFSELNESDILFIDSSHIIRPDGDVLFEFFEILPVLKKGVLIHFHDIFTPNHYPKKWIQEEYRLWNEQYLLEAFLSYNNEFEVLFAANYMWHRFQSELVEKFGHIGSNINPGSFWIRRL